MKTINKWLDDAISDMPSVAPNSKHRKSAESSLSGMPLSKQSKMTNGTNVYRNSLIKIEKLSKMSIPAKRLIETGWLGSSRRGSKKASTLCHCIQLRTQTPIDKAR